MLEKGIYFAVRDKEELAHTGVKGMKWGRKTLSKLRWFLHPGWHETL